MSKSYKKDPLGSRMKEFYESITKLKLPRRSYSIIRLDGKAFHTFTRGMIRPFDQQFTDVMNETAKYLCENIQGAKFAFVQSDEISILMTDFDKLETSAWFDNTVQKIVSVSSSYATAKFNQLIPSEKLAMFDSRVFTIPSRTEVQNYFIWRQQDTRKNCIQSIGQSIFSQKELHGQSGRDIIQMLDSRDYIFEDVSESFRHGRIIFKVELETGRTQWTVESADWFSVNEGILESLVPIQD